MVKSEKVGGETAAFEAELGTPVFDKGPRGDRLTHAGEALLQRAEGVEEGIFAATRAVVGHDQQTSGDVRITLPLVLLPPLAAHLGACCVRVLEAIARMEKGTEACGDNAKVMAVLDSM